MIHGIIDIGSNTIRLNVYQINENNNFKAFKILICAQ